MPIRAFLEDTTGSGWERRVAEAHEQRLELAKWRLPIDARKAIIGYATHSFAARGVPMPPEKVEDALAPFLDDIRFDLLESFFRKDPQALAIGADFVDALCAAALVVAYRSQDKFRGVEAGHVSKVWEWLRENCVFPLVGICD